MTEIPIEFYYFHFPISVGKLLGFYKLLTVFI